MDSNGQSWEIKLNDPFQAVKLTSGLVLSGPAGATVNVRAFHNNDQVAEWSHDVTETPTEYTHTETLGAPISASAGDEFAVFTYTWDQAFISGPNSFSLCNNAGPDITALGVEWVWPPPDSTGNPRNTIFQTYFTQQIDQDTMDQDSFSVSLAGNPVPATVDVSTDGKTATLTPSADLDPNSTYTAEITTAVTDLSGNALENDYSWQVHIGPSRDTTPPTIKSIVPADGATGVSQNTDVIISFSESMDVSTFTEKNMYVTDESGETIPITEIYYDPDLQCVVLVGLVFIVEVYYTIHLEPELADIAGNILGVDLQSGFTIGSGGGSGSSGGGCFLSGCQ